MNTGQARRKSNAFEETLAKLLQPISLGQYILGEKLPAERELAKDLEVPRATLRSALQELQATGVLEISRGRYGGATLIGLPKDHERYSPESAADLEDAIRFRVVLDRAAARMVAQSSLSSVDRQLLCGAADACGKASEEEYRQFDSRFHLVTAELTGVPSLLAASRQARDRINAMLNRIPMIGTNLAHSNEQHRSIVGAILACDAHTAERLADEHTQGSGSLLRGYLREQD